MQKNSDDKGAFNPSKKWVERNARIASFSQSVSLDPLGALAAEQTAYLKRRPELKKILQDKHRRAVNLAQAHEYNGANLFVDKYLRNFLREFNARVLNGHGSKLPLSFNVLNSFIEPDSETLILKLLPEKVYSLGLDTILEFITDPKTTVDFSLLSKTLDEFEIYEFNMIGGYADFRIPGHDKLVFCGSGFVRDHDELAIVGIFGKENLERKQELIPLDKAGIFPGKEKLFDKQTEIDFSDDELFGDPGYQPIILLTRVSLSDQKIQARYILEEKKGAFFVLSDDQEMFDGVRLQKGAEAEEYIKNNIEGVQKLDGLFSLLTLMPSFITKLQSLDDDLILERHPTKFKTDASSTAVRRLKAMLPSSETPNFVPVQTLVAVASEGTYSTPVSGLKVETKGFWKTLPLGAVGTNRHGQPVQGKTWVEVTSSWFETLGFQQGDVGKSVVVDMDNAGGTSGFIYVMRTAAHARDVYKIGYTTKSPDERALELGGETGQPDMFNVVQFWKVRDPRQVERQIHAKLESSRLRMGREFFKMKYYNIRAIIDQVIAANNALLQD